MNYVVIDLEMCKVPKHYRGKSYNYANEIIQLGAVLLDETYNIMETIRLYVHPEHGVIDQYIQNLTGIHNYQVKKAPCLGPVLKELHAWIGERDYKVYAWSEMDYAQLQHEISSKGICDTGIDSFMMEERWVDYQAIFGKRFQFQQSVKLGDALNYCDIEAEGRLHDGLYDAINTAKLIKTLELDENFVIHTYEQDTNMESEPLNFMMGDLFAGLKLELSA